MTAILVLGSGPNVIQSRQWDRAPFEKIVAVNNAWRVRPDWDVLICPDDFPIDRRPEQIVEPQQIITSDSYVPAQNTFGGFVYAGGTMAFTACYWALAAFRPSVIAVMGCDMTYATAGDTHFYGTGTADPLRADITLRSLAAKSNRLLALAALEGCALVNLSAEPSRLTFPRATPSTSAACGPVMPDATVVAAALAEEARLAYHVPSGRYWREEHRFDTAAIDALDALWLKAIPLDQTSL